MTLPISSARKLSSRVFDEVRFLRNWVEKPLTTGAVSPSGRALARLMAQHVDPDSQGLVIELGPGTGVVTSALIDRGIDPERIVAVEYNDSFCTLLRKRHPAITVVQGDAYQLRPTLKEHADQPIAAIVSSLPLFNRSPVNREKLLDQALDLLPPGGPFIQFSYALVPPIPDDPKRFTLERTNWVVMNLPPARVWCYRALDAV